MLENRYSLLDKAELGGFLHDRRRLMFTCAFPSPARRVVRAADLLPVAQVVREVVPEKDPPAAIPLRADLAAEPPLTQCGWRDAQHTSRLNKVEPPHKHLRINTQKPGEGLDIAART